MSVSAGKLQQWVQVTHEVIDEIGATEGQLESEDNLYHVMNKAPCPGYHYQKGTESMVHDRIVQGLADGHIVVIGHGTEDNHLHPSKEVLSKELGHAAFERNGFPPKERVHNHLWDNDRGEACIQEGQKSQEEVHGGAPECWAATDGHHN